MLGGFGVNDATIDFYLRVNSLLQPGMTVLDFGAGRGAWSDSAPPMKADILQLKGKVATVIAADIDHAVLENPNCDEALLIEDGRVPLEDASVDLIISDFVLEHVASPEEFVAEIARLLKPKGWFCARTPHYWNYIAACSRLLPDKLEGRVLGAVQPGRHSIDVFPKIYKMNREKTLSAIFPGWEDYTYIYRCEPSYYFGSKAIYGALDFAHRLLPKKMVGTLMIFKQKPE